MKTTKLIGLTVALVILCCNLNAQPPDATLKTVYERETIYLDGSSNKFVKNNQRKRIGFFAKGLNSEFENSSAETKQEFKTFKKRNKRG